MKRINFLYIAFWMATISIHCQAQTSDSNLTLTYTQPGNQWEEALPLGNGRLGAMPDGGVFEENITSKRGKQGMR